MNWAETHKPKNLENFIGNKIEKQRFLKFVNNFEKEKKRAVLLWGEQGIGKTLLPLLAAEELGMEIVEFNASEKRSKSIIEQTLANTAISGSIFAKKRIILIDDIDCLSSSDRGGLAEIIKIIRKTRHPIIFTALDYWGKKIKPLRTSVLNIHLKEIEEKEVTNYLLEICEKEGVRTDKRALSQLVLKNKSDIRASIMDIQILCEHKKELDTELVKSLTQYERKTDLKKTIIKMSKAKDLNNATQALSNSDENFDDIFTWVSENIAHTNLNKEELQTAYEMLSMADVFRGRIISKQYWRFLSYVMTLISGACMNTNISKIEYPRRIRKLFETQTRRAKNKSLSQKLSLLFHASPNKIVNEYFFLLKTIIEKNPQDAQNYGLDEQDVAFLLNY